LNPKLAPLLLDLKDLSDEDAEELTYREYIKLYTNIETHTCTVGFHKTHDGEEVIFYEDRFKHAFFTSSQKTSRQYAKDEFQRNRASRVRWIAPVIRGDIEGTECWRIFPRKRYHSDVNMPSRLYILWDEKYLVWLEPRRSGGWWFSTAYVAKRGKDYISKIIRNGICLWRNKIPRD